MSRRRWDLSRLTSRAVHLILLVAWVALVAWKIHTFISEPTASETHFEDGTHFPYVTVCPFLALGNDTLAYLDYPTPDNIQYLNNISLLDLFKTEGMTIQEMHPSDPFRPWPVTDLVEYYGQWTEKVNYARGGLCHTLTMSNALDNPEENVYILGLARQFNFTEVEPSENPEEWYEVRIAYGIYVHKQDDFWGGIDKEFTKISDSEMSTFWVTHGTSLQQLVINPERESTPNLRRQPCEEDPDYSRSKCWRDCYLDSLNCSLLEGDNTTTKPICKGVDYFWFADIYNSFMFERPEEKEDFFTNRCSCLRPCVFERYSLLSQPSVAKSTESWIMMNLFFSPVRRMSETAVTYDVIDLLADIGGFMGLLLGYSLLSVIDDLKTFVTRLLGRRAASAVGSPGEPQQRQDDSGAPRSEKRRIEVHLHRPNERPRMTAGVYFVRPEMNAGWGKSDFYDRHPQNDPGMNC